MISIQLTVLSYQFWIIS